jgi:predicted phosphodiesterase
MQMRVFALSDIHADYKVNAEWVAGISSSDYQADVLILAGDVANTLSLLGWCISTLSRRFGKVLFVPGNHDLWVVREPGSKTSLEKFEDVVEVATSNGASMRPFRHRRLSIIPLLGWYDNSFGEPGVMLKRVWRDYRACRWPAGFEGSQIAAHFAMLNEGHAAPEGDKVITFSHFLPRIDLMPNFIPKEKRWLYPVLGTLRLEEQLRRLNARIHIYGHSHLNRAVTIDGIRYINNAFGYPRESGIASKQLLCIHES